MQAHGEEREERGKRKLEGGDGEGCDYDGCVDQGVKANKKVIWDGMIVIED